jgi:hypothetical protein
MGDASKPGRADFRSIAAASRTVLLFAIVIAAFGATAFAAVRMMDTGPDVETLRQQRVQQQAEYERKAGKGRKKGKHRKAAAGAPIAAAAPAQKPRKRRSWAAKADALCEQAGGQSLVLVERYSARTPAETLELLDAAVRLSSGLVDRIERLGPAPNRQLHAQLIPALRASVADDRQGVESLRARWSTARLRRVLATDGKDRAVRRLFTRLGSATCAGL